MFEDIMQQMKITFRQEAEDLLDELGNSLLALDAEPDNAEVINRVFRAMHTIKGSGAAAGFDRMSHFAHGIEDVFNQAREGLITVTPPLVDSALLACDVLKGMLNAKPEETDALETQATEVLTALRVAAGVAQNAVASDASPAEVSSSGVNTVYKLVFRPNRELFYSGTDPVLLLDELRQLGTLELRAHFEQVPLLEEMDPELCYTWWTGTLSTSRPLSQIQNVFEFVQDDCEIQLEPLVASPKSASSGPAQPATPDNTEHGKGTTDAFASTAWQCVDTIDSSLSLLTAGDREISTWKSYLRAVRTLKSSCSFCGKTDVIPSLASQEKTLKTILEEESNCSAQTLETLSREHEMVRAAMDRRLANKSVPGVEPVGDKASSAAQPTAPQTIRIDQAKLDRLMRAVGELLVSRGAFPTLSRKLNDDHHLTAMAKEVRDAGANITRIADELQDTVMAMRMLPIKTTLQRFPRLIRDMSRSLTKNLALAVEGEDTELDKAVIEQIGDPLVHLVRNAADHGIEMPEQRAAKGKPPEGTIRIRAFNEGSQVVLQVSDDGRGLDTTLLKRKAVEKGLLTDADAAGLSEQDAYQLIFMPGFSTAEKVTDVSGRGVGMDVVRSNVRALHGTIDIASQVDKGTEFTIRLPTSLMVSKGILFRAGGEDYIIPMESLIDMTKVPVSAIREYQGERLAHVRGQVYQLISMAELLADSHQASRAPAGNALEKHEEIPVAIVQHGELRYGIMVDRFVDEVEVIIKPLVGGLADLSLFSGATILGDGRIVLVINPMTLPRHQQAHGGKPTESSTGGARQPGTRQRPEKELQVA